MRDLVSFTPEVWVLLGMVAAAGPWSLIRIVRGEIRRQQDVHVHQVRVAQLRKRYDSRRQPVEEPLVV